MDNNNLIELINLKKYFATGGGMLHAVDDVNLTIKKGTTLGVVGESGCGKSTLGRTIIRLLDSTDGKIILDGENITHVKGKKLASVRQKMQMIFQDPYSSLDPRKSVREIVSEPLIVSKKYKKGEIEDAVQELMDLVGVDERLRNSYPHELDGGRRQRVGIARALALNPQFVVCDEPVSALDVSIQAQVLNLLKRLQMQRGLTYMFVTHDLSVVKYISDEICVMYLGQVVEKCSSKELFKRPLHPYTKALLEAIPTIDITREHKRELLKGEITSPINPKPGCRFAARCKYVCDKCSAPQSMREIEKEHFVSCCRVEEIS